MAVPKKKTTKSKKGKRRSHHALKKLNLAKCSNCGGYILPHRVCPNCGFYKGKEVIKIREKKKKKEKEKKK